MEVRGRRCLVTGAGGGIGSACVDALRAAGAAARLVADVGDVDVLVNCAGNGLYGPVAELSPADAQRVFAVNLEAPIALARLVLPGMLSRGSGHVVNVGSLVAHVPKRLEAVYAGSKSGLAGFTRSLRAELRGTGVGVSLMSPAVVSTGFFAARGAPYARRWPRPVPASRVGRGCRCGSPRSRRGDRPCVACDSSSALRRRARSVPSAVGSLGLELR